MKKSVLVTGGASGVGEGCVSALAARDCSVVMACRDRRKGEVVAARIDGEASVEELDLASVAAVKRFVALLAARGAGPFDALVLNAGVMSLRDAQTTVDGFEVNFGTNHLGHFLLVGRLLEAGLVHASGRIIAVSSSGHDPRSMAARAGPPRWIGAAALATPSGAARIPPMSRYTTSKLCNVLFTRELDRRLRAAGTKITVNAFDPGVVLGTSLGRDLGPVNRFLSSQPWLLRLLGARLVTASQAGADLADLAVNDRFDGVTGQYFAGTKSVPSSQASYDPAIARELWETSERLVEEKLTFPSTP